MIRGDIQAWSVAAEISIAFQPIVSVTQNRIAIYGYEALARDSGGACPPLLAGACASEEVYALNFHCQRLALMTASVMGLPASLAMNVMPGVICHPRYGIREIMYFAQEIGFPINRIILEITELERVPDYRPLRRHIDEFRQEGLRVALDDFGTGFNGLNTLLELRPDIIKIDMALIRKIETDRDRQALLFGICSGGERLGMKLVAEGIETLDTVKILSRENIDLMQGYLFARPQIGVLPTVDPATREQVARMFATLPCPAPAGDAAGAPALCQ